MLLGVSDKASDKVPVPPRLIILVITIINDTRAPPTSHPGIHQTYTIIQFRSSTCIHPFPKLSSFRSAPITSRLTHQSDKGEWACSEKPLVVARVSTHPHIHKALHDARTISAPTLHQIPGVNGAFTLIRRSVQTYNRTVTSLPSII